MTKRTKKSRKIREGKIVRRSKIKRKSGHRSKRLAKIRWPDFNSRA